ncbi:protein TRIGALACTOSYLDIACYLGLYCEROL 4, chloroplastic [Vigna unguiculata]|uniref:protein TRIGALACTOSYLDIACYLGLYCEROL 4, chloroplastic n=1 Tax=Vigna unguiculata TaxID=3917 RepID=UPI0010161097|nr:protein TRIGALACTOSYLDIACYLGLYCEROL 4, chloroplastic [Vigna unguiculata]
MARLRTGIESAFWDQNVASPQCHDGWAKSVPGDPFPVEASVASKVLRPQQFSFLQNELRLPIVVPFLSPTSSKDLGSFGLQALLLKLSSHRWWLTMTGQFRPRKLIVGVKNEISNAEEFDLSTVKDVAKHFIDKALLSFGLTFQYAFSPLTSVLFGLEGHGEKARLRSKGMLYRKLPQHDLTVEVALPQLFLDHKGKYWDVPVSLSVDLASLLSPSGLRWRVGLHKNGGNPQQVNATDGNPPLSLQPGLCLKGATSYEKIIYFWRDKSTAEEGNEEVVPYDVRLNEPHSAVFGVIGGTFTLWLRNGRSFSSSNSTEDLGVSTSKRFEYFGDLFGSVGYSFQHGKFTKKYGDLTRLDARVDISSASEYAKKILNSSRADASASPRLNLILQQQVVGPIVFRADTRIALECFALKNGLAVEDFICSLSYSLKSFESGKVVAWCSPKRKEGMVELRMFEF